MVVEYKTTGYGEEYDIVHDPEQFDLFIDGNCVNDYWDTQLAWMKK